MIKKILTIVTLVFSALILVACADEGGTEQTTINVVDFVGDTVTVPKKSSKSCCYS